MIYGHIVVPNVLGRLKFIPSSGEAVESVEFFQCWSEISEISKLEVIILILPWNTG
jgi:hypothetical protein